MNKKILFVALLFICSAAAPDLIWGGFTEGDIESFRQIYKGFADESPHMKDAENLAGEIEAIDRRLFPKTAELKKLYSETGEISEKSIILTYGMEKTAALEIRLQRLVSQEVLKVLLILFVETAQAMNSRSDIDQAINFLKEAVNMVAEAVTDASDKEAPALIIWHRARKAAAAAHREMYEERKLLIQRQNGLLRDRDRVEKDVRTEERTRENLVRRRDRALSEYQRRLDTFLRTVPPELQEAARKAKSGIDNAVKEASAAENAVTPDFSPYVSLHEKLARALLASRIGVDDFKTGWREAASSAEKHYRSALRGEKREDAGRAEKAYSEHKNRAASLEENISKAKEEVLKTLKGYVSAITSIDTRFIDSFAGEHSRRIEAIGKEKARIKEQEGLSAGELEAQKEIARGLEKKYGEFSRFLDSRHEGFSRQLAEAQRAFNEGLQEKNIFLKANSSMSEYAEYRPDERIGEVKNELDRGSAFLATGPLSYSSRLAAAGAERTFGSKAAALETGLEAGKKYLPAARAFISAAENLRPGLNSVREFFTGETGELYKLSAAVLAWEKHYEAFKSGEQSGISMQHKETLAKYGLENHDENFPRAKKLIEYIDGVSASYNSLYMLHSDMDITKIGLDESATEIKEMREREIRAQEVYGAYSRFIDKGLRYRGAFDSYIRIGAVFRPLENEVASAYNSACNTYRAAIEGYAKAADKADYALRYFDERGSFRGLDADKRMEKYSSLVIPFESAELWGAYAKARNTRGELLGMGSMIRTELFTGPEVRLMNINNWVIRPGFSYTRPMEFDREDLPGGMLTIEGQVRVPGSDIDKVLLSLDGGISYDIEADLTGRDSFRYSFRPDENSAYRINVKAVDRRGNTGRQFPFGSAEIQYTGVSHEETVRNFFSSLARSYSMQDRLSFMNMVAWDYAGRFDNLERAVETDFRHYDAIDLQFFPDSVIFSPSRENAEVRIRWIRSWTRTADGKRERDEGETAFRLKKDGGDWKLFSYSGRPIFGMAMDLAIESPMPAGETSPGAGGLLINRNQSLGSYFGNGNSVGFSLIQGKVVSPGDSDLTYAPGGGGEWVRSFDIIGLQSMGNIRLENVTEATEAGYVNEEQAIVGHSYVVICANGNYAKFRITAIAPDSSSITFDWAYQPDGTRNLR